MRKRIIVTGSLAKVAGFRVHFKCYRKGDRLQRGYYPGQEFSSSQARMTSGGITAMPAGVILPERSRLKARNRLLSAQWLFLRRGEKRSA